MKHEQPEAHPSLFQSGLYWGSIYFCRKNDLICYVIEKKVMSSFLQKKTKKIVWCQIDFFDHLQPFLVQPFFDQVPNKGSAFVKCINLTTGVGYLICPQFISWKVENCLVSCSTWPKNLWRYLILSEWWITWAQLFMQATLFLHGLSKFACHTPRVHRCTVCHCRHHLGGGVGGVDVVAASTAPYAKYAALSSTFWGDRNDPTPEDGVAKSIIRKPEVTITHCYFIRLNPKRISPF